MGKPSNQTAGYKFKLIYHDGLTYGPIDAFLEYRGGDLTAWKGRLTASGTLSINAPKLWGGDKDQGGIVGSLDVMFGEGTQTSNSMLVANIGDQTVAWRGLATVAFNGLYGSNNPYPQAVSYKLEKIKQGWDSGSCWYPEKAAIPLSIAPEFSVTWSKTEDCPYTFSTPGDETSWDPDPASHTMGTDPWSSGTGKVGLQWLYIDAPDGVPSAFSLDVKVNFDDSGKVIGTHNVTLGPSTAPVDVVGYPRAAGIRVDVPISDAPFSGWVCIACVDVLDIDTGATIGSDTGHGMIVTSVNVILDSFSINPAHALYYLRTQSHLGNEPTANIDEDSFTAAADQLYAEGFGICVRIDPDKESPQDVEDRICKLIGGSVNRSMEDGKLHLDLARGDYVLDDLPIVTDDDVLDFSEQPTSPEGAVNSVQVRYFDPERKETIVTPSVEALGLIDEFGRNQQLIEYPEIPTASLAAKVAQRELMSFITPSRVFDLVCKPTVYALRPNQYVRLQLAKRGISDMVCIVGDKQGGTLKSGAIRLNLAQDIYTMPDYSIVEVEPGVDTRPPATPVVIADQIAFEAPYIDVCAAMSRADLAALPDETGFLEAAAVDPAISRDFTLAVDAGAGYEAQGDGDWCPTLTINEAAIRSGLDTSFTFANGKQLADVAVGAVGIWGTEWVKVTAIDVDAGTVAFGRGCADTTPQEHAANERVFFYGEGSAHDTTEYTDGETVSAKLLTNTWSQELDASLATAMSVTFDQRQVRPYPPAKLRINDEAAPSYLFDVLTVEWVHRDRVGQADQLLDTEAATVGPEAGTTYTMRTYVDNVLDNTQTGISGATATVTPSGDGTVRIEVESERDGLASWQAQVREFAYTAVELEPLTFDGDAVTIFSDLIYME